VGTKDLPASRELRVYKEEDTMESGKHQEEDNREWVQEDKLVPEIRATLGERQEG